MGESQQPMEISVLICTHDRAGLLACTLESLDRARRPTDVAVSIVVVANACTDATAEVLRAREARTAADGLLPLRWVEEPTLGKAFALNRALPLLRAPAVAFIDDDHRVDEGFLEAMAAALARHPDTRLFCGRILPDWDGSEPRWVHEPGPYRIYPPPIPVFDAGAKESLIDPGGAVPGGGNLLLRAELLHALGSFQTGLGPRGHNLAGGEDSEFVARAMGRGEPLRYLPDMLQYHHVDLRRLRLPAVLRLAYHRSRSVTRIQAGTRRLPPFLWRKAASYLARALCPGRMSRTRFYLVRLAAVLGEMRGIAERSAVVDTRT